MKPVLPLAVVLCAAPAWAQQSLSVRVVDGAGVPIPNAQVVVEVFSEKSPAILPKATDASGTALFSFPALAKGKPAAFKIIAGAKGYAFNSAFASEGESNAEVRLQEGAPWRGQIVDEAGKPLAGAMVSITRAMRDRDFRNMIDLPEGNGALAALYSTKSKADGSFVIDNVPAETDLSFEVTLAGYSLGRRFGARAGVEENIKLVRAGTLRGRVLDPDGKPVAGLRVYATGGSFDQTKTDAQGVFTITHLAPGTYRIEPYLTRKEPYLLLPRSNVQVVAGKTSEVGAWRAVRGVLIRGTVRDATTKKPLADASVAAASPKDAARNDDSGWARTDATGNFALRVLPGTYTVRSSGNAVGYMRSNATYKVQIDANGKQSGLPPAFLLPPAPIIRGVTVDEQGRPIAAQLSVGFGRTINSDAKGRWEFTPSEAQDLGFGGGTTETGYFEVVRPKQADWPVKGPVTITVRRKPWDSVSGRVVSTDGTPVAGVRVEAEYLVSTGNGSAVGTKTSASTDKDGRYTLTRMRGTDYLKVSGQRAGFEFQSGGEVSRKNETVGVSDLVFVPLGGKVEGTTQPGAQILIAGREALANDQGQFAFTGLPSGNHTAFAAKDNLFGTATGDAALDIQLAPLQPQPQDQALAEQMWADIKGDSRKDVTLQGWFSPPSFEDSLKAAQATGDLYRIAEAAQNWKQGDSLELLRAVLETIKTPDQRADSFLQAALATKDPELMKRALEESETVFKGATTSPTWRESQLYQSAVLRERMNGAEDGRLALGRALAHTLQTHPERTKIEEATITETGRNDELSSDAAIVAQGSPALLREVLDNIDEGSGFKIAALARAIPVVAKTHGVEAAEPLLKELKAMNAPTLDLERNYTSFDPAWAYGQAVYELLPLIGPTNPAKALELARQVEIDTLGGNQRVRALALAATYQTPEVAVPLYREALQTISTDDAPRIAALVWEKDHALGEELFAIARKRAEDEMKSDMHWRDAWVPFAFYYARVNPAQARLILEREWTQNFKAKVDTDELALIPIAMSAVDAQRADELARQIPGDRYGFGEGARARIARYLYADDATRQGFVLTRIAGGPAWNPGPLQW